MLKLSELRAILGVHFTWHKSRLDCFLQILMGLFIVRAVSLRIKNFFIGSLKTSFLNIINSRTLRGNPSKDA